MADPGELGGVADERLRLVLLCAHPSLPPEAAAALRRVGGAHRLPGGPAEPSPLLARAGSPDEALAAYDTAIARCGNEAERTHLEERRAALTDR